MNLRNQFAGQRILVTGASGFIGSHLCNRLSAQKAEVHAVSRKAQTDSSDIHWWQADLDNLETVRSLIQAVKPDVIYHLASHVTGSREIAHVLPALYSNLISTVHLLMAATEIGCRRLVLAGSLEEPDLEYPIPASPYAAAKGSCSAYAAMFHQLYQPPVVTARIFMVYGPGQSSRFLIPYVISSLLNGSPPKISSGKRAVDWIYIDDVVAGLLELGDAPDVEGCTIDLGSGLLTTIREVVEHLTKRANRPVQPLFGAIPDRPLERIRAANSDSYAQLNWKPITPLAQGLNLTLQWYEDQQQTLLTAATPVSCQ